MPKTCHIAFVTECLRAAESLFSPTVSHDVPALGTDLEFRRTPRYTEFLATEVVLIVCVVLCCFSQFSQKQQTRRDWAENLKNTLGFVVFPYIDALKCD